MLSGRVVSRWGSLGFFQPSWGKRPQLQEIKKGESQKDPKPRRERGRGRWQYGKNEKGKGKDGRREKKQRES